MQTMDLDDLVTICIFGACAFLYLPLWPISRGWRRGRGAQRSCPRRSPSQQVLSAAVEEVSRPITAPKRRLSGGHDSMKPPKRRNLDLDRGPWDDQSWVKENNKGLDVDVAYDNHKHHHKRRIISYDRKTPHSQRYPPKRHMPSRYYSSKPSPMSKDAHLSRTPDRDLQFLWSDEDESDSNQSSSRSNGSLQKESAADLNEKLNANQQDFTPVRPSNRKLQSSPLTPEERASLDAGSVIDEEEELEYRRFLRGQPESFDTEGYKVPIDGFISPDTKRWNKQHELQLEQQAVTVQQTPSKLPQRLPTFSPRRLFRSQNKSDTTGLVKAEDEVKPCEAISTEEKPGEKRLLPSPIAKEEKTNTDGDRKRPTVPETPAQLFEGLRISDTVRATRTPKAGLFSTVKTDRKTRYQKAIEEREAAKARDEYKMVPLSEKWDTKVRGAVRTGTSDDKYKPTDFARCAPMYAGPGQDKWLSDVVINDYIALVAQHGNKNDRPTQVPTYVALSSYLYTKIYDNGPDQIPASWTRRKKIPGKSLLDCEVIFIPINAGMHWTLCVVEPKTHRRITMYNSLGYGSNKRHAEAIDAWLEAHLGASYVADEWTINWQGESPQQANGHDCGVFTCTTARQIMLGQMETNPYSAEIMPTQRKRMVAELLHGDLLKASES